MCGARRQPNLLTERHDSCRGNERKENDSICYTDILDNKCARSPTSVAVIGFTGSQGHPPDSGTVVYPGDSSPIPGRSDIKEGRP